MITGQTDSEAGKEEKESVPATEQDARADQIVRRHTYGAAGAGLIPIPILDLLSLTGIQLNMLRQLADLYGVPYRKDLGKAAIGTLIGSVTPVGIAAPVASMLKMVPLVGYTSSVLTVSITGGAATWAVGRVFNQHFASGGTFLDFNPAAVREHFAKQFEEGKKVSASLKKSSH